MKLKKILLAVLVISTLAVAVWTYWEQDFSLMAALPDVYWQKVEISLGEPGAGETMLVCTDDVDDVLTALEQAQVNRGPEFRSMSQPYFKLVLYKGEAYPTYITVVENGQISVAVELEFDHYQYYEDGGTLYAALMEIASDMS